MGGPHTIIVISSILPAVGDETLAAIDAPFAVVSWGFACAEIGSNSHTDNHIALALLLLHSSLARTRRVFRIFKCRCAGRTRALRGRASAVCRRALWIARIRQDRLPVAATI